MWSAACPARSFEDEIARIKREHGVRLDTDLDVDALRELTRRFLALYDFPSDPREQLRRAILAVFDSWTGDRAVAYRRINGIPDDWGTAVNVQQMVFGNKGEDSGSGVAFSRDEVTGAPEPSGDFITNAQGEDVVSGVRTPRDLSELGDWMPAVDAQLREILRNLERHYKDMQDTEFTVEEGRLYMLQTRGAKRPAQAAVRFAVDAVEEGLMTTAEAIATIDAGALDALLHPTFAPDARFDSIATRRGGLAGRGQGGDRLHRAGCRGSRGGGPGGDPRAPVHRGRRRRWLPRGEGDPHRRGRQGLARGAGGPRHGPPGRHRGRRAGHRPACPRGARRRSRSARGRPDRDRRLDRPDHARRRAAGDARRGLALRDRARLVRRAAHAGCARQRGLAGGRAPGAASSAPRASGSAGPSTCSWRRTACPRCSAWSWPRTRPAGGRRSTSCCRCSRRTSRGSSRR